MKITTSKDGAFYYIQAPTKYSRKTHVLCLSIPGNRFWSGKAERTDGHPKNVWVVGVSAMSTQYLQMVFPDAEWDGKAKSNGTEGFVLSDPFKGVPAKISGFKPKTKPMPHQAKGFMGSKDMAAFAWFMEQRTGKCWLAINNAAYLYEKGEIDGFVVFTLNSICDTWLKELALHWPERLDHDVHWFKSNKSDKYTEFVNFVTHRKDRDSLPILIMNVEGMAHERIANLVMDFYDGCKSVMTVIDESTSIKKHSAKRTRAVVKVGRMSKFRRVLSGTPITKDVRDLYSQFDFLDPKILGFKNFYFFEHYFVEKEGYEVLGFKNLDKLQAAVTPYIYRVLRKDVFKDLPEAVRQQFTVELTPKMRQLYNTLEDTLIAEFQGKKIETPIVIAQILRLSQITGGFFPYEEDEETKYLQIETAEKNPKIKTLLEILENEGSNAKAIVWARFRPEISLIANSLRKAYGKDCVREIHGGVSVKDRNVNRLAFQEDDSGVRFIVSQMDTGGIGVDMDKAELMIYYSNSYRYESRAQSEARPMSLRQRKSVGIYDIVMGGTVDQLVLQAIAKKKNLAEILDKGNFASWLRME